ncbi:hypothetical protein WISP_05859 [Willisornis vidua]|uniref:Uncharacterized protein n=1 Tax=Willisornis vidua TaxID=1566151 RepID=A0ABQ9DSX1_9PASS|nr:hypothetical protein WISP_05859 [Willisornis vidua]
MTNTLKVAIQKDLNRLEKWTERNLLKLYSYSMIAIAHFQMVYKSAGTVLSCETTTINNIKQLPAVILQNSSRARALRGRPQHLIDYKSYTNTKWLVAWILEQSHCSVSPDIHELVEKIQSVLNSGDGTCRGGHTTQSPSVTFPELLYLESCDDLTTFTTEDQLAERRI